MIRPSTDRIVVHMQDFPTPQSIAQIREFHMAPPPKGRGWSDVGYHFYIRRDGEVEMGRAIGVVGAHAEGWNADSVAICLEGGYGSHWPQPFEAHFTPEQAASLAATIRDVMAEFGPLTIYSHKQCPSCAPEKQCPGFDAAAWWATQEAV